MFRSKRIIRNLKFEIGYEYLFLILLDMNSKPLSL